jgi:hypothetical protein
MKLSTGTFVEIKVVSDCDIRPNGTVVTVFAPDGNEDFGVPPDLEQDLDESLTHTARGESLHLAEVLSRLNKY